MLLMALISGLSMMIVGFFLAVYLTGDESLEVRAEAVRNGFARYEQVVKTNEDCTVSITANVFKWNK